MMCFMVSHPVRLTGGTTRHDSVHALMGSAATVAIRSLVTSKVVNDLDRLINQHLSAFRANNVALRDGRIVSAGQGTLSRQIAAETGHLENERLRRFGRALIRMPYSQTVQTDWSR